MFAAASLAVARCRRGEGPVFLSAETFRMGGHATHDVREARELLPPELFEHWGRRDPIGQFEEFLATGPVELETTADGTQEPVMAERERRNRQVLARIETEVVREVDQAAEAALASRQAEETDPSPQAREGVYAYPSGASGGE
jgi:TPP-dependent pyruvate/acetoin dehydrogenase alpha subunit